MATKNKSSKKQENTVTQESKRNIRNSKPERQHKIVAYLQAAKYNATKIGSTKLAADLDSLLKRAA